MSDKLMYGSDMLEKWGSRAEVRSSDYGKYVVTRIASVMSFDGYGENTGVYVWIENSFGRCDGVKWIVVPEDEECVCGLCKECVRGYVHRMV